MVKKEEIILIVYFILVIAVLAAFVIIFFVVYIRRKNAILKEKYEAEQRFREELSSAKLEIQEETLKNVSWELHDNIGQLLAVASMQLNVLRKKVTEVNKEGIVEASKLVSDSLTEVRALSRSLNNEVIDTKGVYASVENELSRFNRLRILKASLEKKGEDYMLPKEDGIIIFRILQEYFSNIVKHARADKMEVTFNYSPELLNIEAWEDGVGYDMETVENNSGLLNMRSRADLINAKIELNSSVGRGTSLSLRYLTKNRKNEQNDHHR